NIRSHFTCCQIVPRRNARGAPSSCVLFAKLVATQTTTTPKKDIKEPDRTVHVCFRQIVAAEEFKVVPLLGFLFCNFLYKNYNEGLAYKNYN
ncbi:hypothetical protein M8C21_009332, partial [Ambrosia artemisiifolia]